MSGDLLTAVFAVTNEDGLLREKYFENSILYIDRFFIQPEYRDKGIGKVIFPLIIDVLSREAGAVVIIPRPTEENGKDHIQYSDPRYQSILDRMTNFISRYGFAQVDKKTEVWVKNTSLKD